MWTALHLLMSRSLFTNHWRADDTSSIIIWTCSSYAKWQMCWRKSNKQTQMMTNRSYILHHYVTASQSDLINPSYWALGSLEIKCCNQLVNNTSGHLCVISKWVCKNNLICIIEFLLWDTECEGKKQEKKHLAEVNISTVLHVVTSHLFIYTVSSLGTGHT